MFLVALPHRRLSFPEPSAEPMPFVVRVGQLVCLLALGAFRRLVVRKRINCDGSAMNDFGKRYCHALTSQHLLSLFHQCDYPRHMLTKFRRHVGCQCHYG
jgi:hypothetical protein